MAGGETAGIGRVERNRKAAQTSRERKRLEVEKLEVSNRKTEQRLLDMEQQLMEVIAERDRLLQENQQLKGSRPGTPLPPTFKTEPQTFTIDSLNLKTETTNSPTLAPALHMTNGEARADSTSTSELTQYPAAILCDLPCHSEALSEPVLTSTTRQVAFMIYVLNNLFLLEAFKTCYTQILTPLVQILNSIQQGSPLTSTTISQSSLTLMQWLLTTKTSTPRSTFRIQLLKRFLAINPNWARPLRVATGRALSLSLNESSFTAGLRGGDCLGDLETFASSTTLLWAIDQIERDQGFRREDPASELRRTCVLLGVESSLCHKERDWEGEDGSRGSWRFGRWDKDHLRRFMEKHSYA